jgi:hypothetical protein
VSGPEVEARGPWIAGLPLLACAAVLESALQVPGPAGRGGWRLVVSFKYISGRSPRASRPLTSLSCLALVSVSESPGTPVGPAASGEGGVRGDSYVAPRTKHADGMRRRRRITSSSASPSHWPARGPFGIGAARATPAGARARPSRGKTETLEQWTESGTEYQR